MLPKVLIGLFALELGAYLLDLQPTFGDMDGFVGSLCAHFLPGRNLRQLRPRSDWLGALSLSLPVPAVALYSAHDNLVVP